MTLKEQIVDVLTGLPGDLAQATMYPIETLRKAPFAALRAACIYAAVILLLVWML